MNQPNAAPSERLSIPSLTGRVPTEGRRHVLSILDLSHDEVLYLARRAVRMKQARSDRQTLRGRTVGVYFRKTSTRTRTAFVVGAVLDGPQSVAWMQAQHKLFSAMAVMEWCGAGVVGDEI